MFEDPTPDFWSWSLKAMLIAPCGENKTCTDMTPFAVLLQIEFMWTKTSTVLSNP